MNQMYNLQKHNWISAGADGGALLPGLHMLDPPLSPPLSYDVGFICTDGEWYQKF